MEKRSPELWRMAAAALGAPPADCAAFDDSIASCRGAKAAGMRVVGVYDRYFADKESEMRAFCDAYIRDFTELLHSPDASETEPLHSPDASETEPLHSPDASETEPLHSPHTSEREEV